MLPRTAQPRQHHKDPQVTTLATLRQRAATQAHFTLQSLQTSYLLAWSTSRPRRQAWELAGVHDAGHVLLLGACKEMKECPSRAQTHCLWSPVKDLHPFWRALDSRHLM